MVSAVPYGHTDRRPRPCKIIIYFCDHWSNNTLPRAIYRPSRRRAISYAYIIQDVTRLMFGEGVDAFPTLAELYKIASTIPMTSCFCERSFSRLKRIKDYSRAAMSQERLTGLAVQCWQ